MCDTNILYKIILKLNLIYEEINNGYQISLIQNCYTKWPNTKSENLIFSQVLINNCTCKIKREES